MNSLNVIHFIFTPQLGAEELLKIVKPWLIALTCSLADFFQSVRQLELSLNLCPQLLHLPPALCILPPCNQKDGHPHLVGHLLPDQLYDGGGEGHPNQNIDSADKHVGSLF